MKNQIKNQSGFSWEQVGRYAAKIFKYALLIVFALLILLPLFWVVMSSLKTTQEINSNAFSFPKQFYFQNYVNAWNRASMGTYFGNSIFLTAASLALLVLLAVPCSYTLARFKFRGSKAISLIFMAGVIYQYQLYCPAPSYHVVQFRQGDRNRGKYDE